MGSFVEQIERKSGENVLNRIGREELGKIGIRRGKGYAKQSIYEKLCGDPLFHNPIK